jgi:hypothetical protein
MEIKRVGSQASIKGPVEWFALVSDEAYNG